MNQPSNYPTTSDISLLMKDLGYKWSNEAQTYYHENSMRYEYISRKSAESLYKYFIGEIPYVSPLNH